MYDDVRTAVVAVDQIEELRKELGVLREELRPLIEREARDREMQRLAAIHYAAQASRPAICDCSPSRSAALGGFSNDLSGYRELAVILGIGLGIPVLFFTSMVLLA